MQGNTLNVYNSTNCGTSSNISYWLYQAKYEAETNIGTCYKANILSVLFLNSADQGIDIN